MRIKKSKRIKKTLHLSSDLFPAGKAHDSLLTLLYSSSALTAMPTDQPVHLKNLTLLGKDHIPTHGGYLILPSRLSFEDLVSIEKLLPGKTVVYLVEQGAALSPQLRAHVDQDSVRALVIPPDLNDANAYRKAVEAKPDYAEAYTNLGSILQDLDRHAEAGRSGR